MTDYYAPQGGLPNQTEPLTDRAIVHEQTPGMDEDPRLGSREAHCGLRHDLRAIQCRGGTGRRQRSSRGRA